MLKHFVKSAGRICQSRHVAIRVLSTSPEIAHSEVVTSGGLRKIPVAVSRELEYLPENGKKRLIWVENMDTVKEEKLGIINLHPDIFAAPLRLDIIHYNIYWQLLYKKVNYDHTLTRAEVPGGGRKPWPQKGMGKARHGSIRSPLWIKGGTAHGPRSPTTYFFMLPLHERVLGLRSTLTVKLAQDDLHVVDNIDIPTNDPKYLEDLFEERLWGPSVLFINDTDVAPENLAVACQSLKHVNIMPTYGLNVFSMIKHATLVISVQALETIEKQLLFHMHRSDMRHKCGMYRLDQ